MKTLPTTREYWVEDVAREVAGMKGADGQKDGVWTMRRGQEVVLYNTTINRVHVRVGTADVEVGAHSLWEGKAN